MSGLDAYGRPPTDLKTVFKHYQGRNHNEVLEDEKIIGGNHHTVAATPPNVIRHVSVSELCFQEMGRTEHTHREMPVFEWPDLPGLHYIPGLLSDDVQLQLLSRMLHRDLTNPIHQTNIHKHFIIPYDLTEGCGAGDSRSFFNADPSSKVQFQPLQPDVHKPVTIAKFLDKKLRWLTLGGQYDWTEKVYPNERPPDFPSDIAELIQKGFPEMTPQAAIVNVYSPGDTLALHRDVSEVSDRGLVSISLGCEAIFIAGLADPDQDAPSKWRAFLLKSGDAIYMSGVSRYAWHGVPKIFKNTCPDIIRNWPGNHENTEYESWRGWMAGKRINLNVRQMFDEGG